jgi:hypothetical protein
MDTSRVELRVIDTMGKTIDTILKEFGVTNTGSGRSPAERLRLWQQVASVCGVVIGEAAEKLDISDAVVDKFRNEVALLQNIGMHRAVGYKSHEEFESAGVLVRLERKIREFFVHPTYHVGQSQRYVAPIFCGVPWKVGLELLSYSLSNDRRNRQLRAVGSNLEETRKVSVTYDDLFDEQYSTHRRLINREPIQSDAYVLCGVHGGRDTHEYTAKDSLIYFAKTHRLPLVLSEAISLYVAHPDFLGGRNANVVLLGEECDGKFVTLCYDEGKATIRVGFISSDEELRGHQPSGLLSHQFHETYTPPSYGKPSAGMVIVP